VGMSVICTKQESRDVMEDELLSQTLPSVLQETSPNQSCWVRQYDVRELLMACIRMHWNSHGQEILCELM
jgi:hypothetical protein